MRTKLKRAKLKPLPISCTTTDCEQNLHYFKTDKRLPVDKQRKCPDCGADLVDWPRVHSKDLADAANTIRSLKFEWIRHHYWHATVDEKARLHAQRKGLHGLEMSVRSRLEGVISKVNPLWDGRQTPKTGNVIYYAQHATASCCRKCMHRWHGVPTGRQLTTKEVDYFATLIGIYIRERMPNLSLDGEHIPRKPANHKTT